MHQTYIRDRFTWLAYLMRGYFSLCVNSLGPVMPFLKADLHLSYTVSSLHFTALGTGILLVGLLGHKLVDRLGRLFIIWNGAIGMSAGICLLIWGKTPAVTIPGGFLVGCFGALILAIAPAALSDHHGPLGTVAISEANVFALTVGVTAPLLVGWSAAGLGNWRLLLGAVVLAPLLFRLVLGKVSLLEDRQVIQKVQSGRPLPWRFWYYWSAIVLSEGAEYCMIFYSPTYLEQQLGLLKANAALASSLFVVGMILGRLAGTRLVRRFSMPVLITASALLALAGFLLFWLASAPFVGLAGLFITGLGIANLYTLTLSLAISAAKGSTAQAGVRSVLSTGSSILVAPILLGRLVDLSGIRPAYGLVAVLLLGLLVLIQSSRLAFFQKILSAPPHISG
jgi:fucose permease